MRNIMHKYRGALVVKVTFRLCSARHTVSEGDITRYTTIGLQSVVLQASALNNVWRTRCRLLTRSGMGASAELGCIRRGGGQSSEWRFRFNSHHSVKCFTASLMPRNLILPPSLIRTRWCQDCRGITKHQYLYSPRAAIRSYVFTDGA